MKLLLTCLLLTYLWAGCYKQKDESMYAKTEIIQRVDSVITDGAGQAIKKIMLCKDRATNVFGDSFSRWDPITGKGVGGLSWVWQYQAMVKPIHPFRSFAGSGSTSTQARTSSDERAIVETLADKYMKDNGIIWTGRNNYGDTATVFRDIDAIIERFRKVGNHDRYVVLGILKGDYPSEYRGQPGAIKIDAFNASAARRYAGHFINPQPALLADYNPDVVTDAFFYNEGITPATLRADKLHLNTAGHADIAELMNNSIDWCGCN